MKTQKTGLNFNRTNYKLQFTKAYSLQAK